MTESAWLGVRNEALRQFDGVSAALAFASYGTRRLLGASRARLVDFRHSYGFGRPSLEALFYVLPIEIDYTGNLKGVQLWGPEVGMVADLGVPLGGHSLFASCVITYSQDGDPNLVLITLAI